MKLAGPGALKACDTVLHRCRCLRSGGPDAGAPAGTPAMPRALPPRHRRPLRPQPRTAPDNRQRNPSSPSGSQRLPAADRCRRRWRNPRRLPLRSTGRKCDAAGKSGRNAAVADDRTCIRSGACDDRGSGTCARRRVARSGIRSRGPRGAGPTGAGGRTSLVSGVSSNRCSLRPMPRFPHLRLPSGAIRSRSHHPGRRGVHPSFRGLRSPSCFRMPEARIPRPRRARRPTRPKRLRPTPVRPQAGAGASADPATHARERRPRFVPAFEAR